MDSAGGNDRRIGCKTWNKFCGNFGTKEFKNYKKGDIIVIELNESTDFENMEEGTQNVAAKYPRLVMISI